MDMNSHFEQMLSGGKLDYTSALMNLPVGGDGMLGPVIGRERQLAIRDAVGASGVDLRHKLVWRDTASASGFIHELDVGEVHKYSYPGNFGFTVAGDWDIRRPLVYPAMAGLDVMDAGFDETYLRGLRATEIIITGRAEDFDTTSRQVVSRYLRRGYHPFRLLVRGAALWATLLIGELASAKPTIWHAGNSTGHPAFLKDLRSYAQLCRSQLQSGGDVLYMRCYHANEGFMIDVLQALAAPTCPVRSGAGVSKLWPPLNNPTVAYNSPAERLDFVGSITASEVYDTMQRYCSLHDCASLWLEALQLVQVFLCRPQSSGLLAGAGTVHLFLPGSDLGVGVIGPLLAGLSSEGMGEKLIPLPNPTEFLYGGAVRGVFVTAGFYEGLRLLADVNPVRIFSGRTTRAHFRPLTDPVAVADFWLTKARPAMIAAGWNALTRSIQCIGLNLSSSVMSNMLDASRVPWWTHVLPHMADNGHGFLSSWILPARLDRTPDPNRWYLCKAWNLVSDAQVTATLRWTKAQFRYGILTDRGEYKVLDLVLGSHNRFMPSVRPLVQCGSAVGTGQMKFPINIAASAELVRKLGKCTVEMLHVFTNDYIGLDDENPPCLPDWMERSLLTSASSSERLPELPQGPDGAEKDDSVREENRSRFMQGLKDLSRYGVDMDPAFIPLTNVLSSVERDRLGLRNAVTVAARLSPSAMVTSLKPEKAIVLLDELISVFDMSLQFTKDDFIVNHITAARREAANLRSFSVRAAIEPKEAVELQLPDTGETTLAGTLEANLGSWGAEAVDDPTGPGVSVQDFSPAPSGPSSQSRVELASSAEESGGMEALGFLQPEGSLPSASS